MINNNLAVNPNIQRFEQVYTQQAAKDKTSILGRRIGGGVAIAGAGIGFVASFALIGALATAALAVSLVALPLIVIGVAGALLGAGVYLLARGSQVNHDRQLSFIYEMDTELFSPIPCERQLNFISKSQIQNLGRYGLISEKTCQEFVGFKNRLAEAASKYKKNDSQENYDILEGLKKEFIDQLRPQIWSELPLTEEDYNTLNDTHRRYQEALPQSVESSKALEACLKLKTDLTKRLVRSRWKLAP